MYFEYDGSLSKSKSAMQSFHPCDYIEGPWTQWEETVLSCPKLATDVCPRLTKLDPQ